MPESVGDVGILIDRENTSAIVDAILQLHWGFSQLIDYNRKSVDWVQNMTWERSGQALYHLCEKLLKS